MLGWVTGDIILIYKGCKVRSWIFSHHLYSSCSAAVQEAVPSKLNCVLGGGGWWRRGVPAEERNTFLRVLITEHEEYGRLLIYKNCPPPLSSCSGFVRCHAIFEHLGKPQMFDSYAGPDLILIPNAGAFWLSSLWRRPCSQLPLHWGATVLLHISSGTWSSAVSPPLPVFIAGQWVLAVDMTFNQNYDSFLWTLCLTQMFQRGMHLVFCEFKKY